MPSWSLQLFATINNGGYGVPGQARDDPGVCSPDSHFKQHDKRPRSRGVKCPSSVYFSPPLRGRGRRESRVRAAPAVSCANCAKETHTSIQVKRRQSGFPCAMGYGLLRTLPGDRLSCHRHLQGCPCELSASTGAPGPHDFAVRVARARPSRATCVHRIPPQRS